ncbi:hypothetical protein [Candidatus Magnetobacterium casense]|uniref:hypothetical protein n=1 Tax=Candidatus Magnetobacterium casense TaxID=1455061 RepID=UPI00138DD1C1|nr:hypothetical protein [Candidatus Magnetobacterium casensis]
MARQIKRLAAPIRMERGNDNYGEIHIEQRHGQEIRKVGYKGVRDFVEDVIKDFTQIRESGNRLVLVKENGLPHVSAIQLIPTPDGNYYSVVTAYLINSKALTKKKLLWERSPRPPSSGKPEQPTTLRNISPTEALEDDASRLSQSSSSTSIVEQSDESVKGRHGRGFDDLR